MKWKKIITFGVIAGVILSIAGCGNKTSTSDNDNEEFEGAREDTYDAINSEYAPTDEILNATLDDVKIQIGNTVYSPGSPVKDLFNGEWDIKHSDYGGWDAETVDPTLLILPGEIYSLIIHAPDDDEFTIGIHVENTGETNQSVEECTVAEGDDLYMHFGGVDTDYYRENHDVCVWLPGGINYKSTREEVEEVYGERPHGGTDYTPNPVSTCTYHITLESGEKIKYYFVFPPEGAEEDLFIQYVTVEPY